ncbi:uncharacterized protein PV09_02693 [Verruconis gallopava]|uniref:Uncharacterized protein n=1 Tax=Verruconis gallopava TaxID=253628 RepID=A0A0D1YZS7_9PEZI|nr:uncharacterized protein PV09_02693 [Verruconis gallopava]KIW06217.1 hypothetical protein PV09_02693 [Verruconis gallopava]
MSGIWRLLKRKASRRKQSEKTSGLLDGASEPSTPTTNGCQPDPYWEPLTKDEILADLRVEYEATEEDEVEPGSAAGKAMRQKEEVISPATYSKSEIILAEPVNRIWLPHSASTPVDDSREITNLEAGSDSVKRSYMSIIPSTIQMLDARTTLFVWAANFHPAIGRRFSSVIASVKFTPAPPNSKLQASSKARQALRSANPNIVAHAPHKSFGATSSEQRNISWGLELPLSVPVGPVSLGVTPSGQSETQKQVQHAFTITGTARGTPTRNCCVWTVEENRSTERGIPSELQLAALVQYAGPMIMEIDITGRTAGGFLPSHDLRPKTTAMGRKKIVDPKKFKDMLFEFDFGNDDAIQACKKMLEKWTGKVDGAVLEFDQPIARA